MMKRKGLWVWMALVAVSNSCFFLAQSAVSARSLTDILEDKGILTGEEAREVKVEQGKGIELPKGLKGISIGGTYYLEYFVQDYDKRGSENSFRVQRAYLTVGKQFSSWFSTKLTGDITHDAKRGDLGQDASEIGWEFRLKYAYGLFDFKRLGGTEFRLQSELGLVHTASDNYDASLWPYRAQGKHYLDRHSITSTADFGLNAHLTWGELDKDWQKRVSEKRAARWGGIWAGIYNGSGYDHKENNDNKVVEGLIYVRPLNFMELGKGFRIGYHVLHGESDRNFPGSGNYPEWRVNQVFASYQHEYFTIMGQYYWGKGEFRSTDENDRDGYSIAAFVKAPFHKNLKVFGRYDVFDRNDDADDTDEVTKIFGISYDLFKEVMLWGAAEKKDYDKDLEKEDWTMYQVGLAVNF